MLLDNRQLKALSRIRDRYFRRTGNGKQVTHFGDCAVYRHDRLGCYFCSCGLLHDLSSGLDMSLAESLHPAFSEELYRMETQTAPSAEERERQYDENMALLESVFGPMREKTLDEQRQEYEVYRKALQDAFGEEYPEALERLRKRYGLNQ